MEGKVVVITGANAGIGLATAIAIAKEKAKVYIACRSEEKALAAVLLVQQNSGNDNIHFIRLDLNDLDAVEECAAEFAQREERLDVLINNAGMMATSTKHRSKQGFERTIAVNYLGHFLLTLLLIPLLKKAGSSRIINLSSLTHARGRIDFNTLEYWKVVMEEDAATLNDYPLYTISSLTPDLDSLYSTSKLAMILFSNELAERLRGSGVVSNSMCPGIVATNILDDFGWVIRNTGPYVMRILAMIGIGVTVETAAKTPLLLASSPNLETVSGKYFTHQKEKKMAPVACDRVAARRLWNISYSLIGSRRDAISEVLTNSSPLTKGKEEKSCPLYSSSALSFHHALYSITFLCIGLIAIAFLWK